MKFIKPAIGLMLLCVITLACSKKKLTPEEQIRGNWLIIYPQHHLKDSIQRKMYPRIQDSIIDLFGLKTISFTEANFIQTDSINVRPGKWTIDKEKKIAIKGGGQGFQNFEGEFIGLKHDTMMIREYIKSAHEEIEVIWHFKKLNNQRSTDLIETKSNWWRTKPVKEESVPQLKVRLAAILSYYSKYYDMVADESIYFVHKRVALPLSYYQHSIGLRSLKQEELFTKCFYDSSQAAIAKKILGSDLEISRELYPSANNFVKEYAQFLQILSKELE